MGREVKQKWKNRKNPEAIAGTRPLEAEEEV
jgi:hypothetical protein